MSAVITLSGAGKIYPGGIVALRDVDLTIAQRELVAIVGRSGSGKSTLLHIMGTLDRPSEGRVEIAGRVTATLSDRDLAAVRAEHIGFVFQRFFLIESISAAANVAQALVYAGVPREERVDRALDALEMVGLAHRAGQPASKLSGGEQQRVAIARAVVTRPSILFADEPTGNLDSAMGREIVDLLLTLNESGTTIVLITHDAQLARAFPRRIDLADGRIVADRLVEQVGV